MSPHPSINYSNSYGLHFKASLPNLVVLELNSLSRSYSSSKGIPGGSGRLGACVAGTKGGVGLSKLGLINFSIGSFFGKLNYSYNSTT